MIPFCLYTNERSSLIELAEKNPDGTFRCQPKPDKRLIKMFYAIDPDIRPNPTYGDLLCLTNANDETIKISTLYDPFNIDVNCLRMIAWLEYTPNSLPLYLFTNGNNLLISLENNVITGYQPYDIPVIHVLPSPLPFSNSYGKCVPDPEGKLDLDQCLVLYNKNITRPEYIGKYPNVISYLESRYGKEKKQDEKKLIWLIFGIIIFILFLAWLFSIELKMKTKGKRKVK